MVTENRPGQGIYPSLQITMPESYPDPKPGQATRLTLTTPDKQPVGVLIYNDSGLAWTPDTTSDDPAVQEYTAEVLSFIRGNKAEGTPLPDVVEEIRDAYTGDYTEDAVTFVPAAK